MSDETTNPFVCPVCGGDKFKVSKQPESIEDMEGAECNNCGRAFKEEDIKDQAKAIAHDIFKDAFKGIKGIKFS